MKLYGVWYDNGRIDFGWLNYEGKHGRPYRAEYSTLEEAQEAADLEAKHDSKCVFHASLIGVDEKKLFKTVHKLARAMRLELAEREVRRARAAVRSDDD